MREDVMAKIAAKMEKKREKIDAKVQEYTSVREGVLEEIAALDEELAALTEELAAESAETNGGRRARMEAQRERMLAKQERLQLKAELLADRIERTQEMFTQFQVPFVPTPPSPPLVPSQRTAKQREEEQLRILEMVAEGAISAEDAARLLEALGKGETRPGAPSPQQRPRVVRIRVTDLEANRPRVNVVLPLSLVRGALKRGRGITGIGIEGIDLDLGELDTLLNTGMTGHIIDVVDDEDGERVEIIVE